MLSVRPAVRADSALMAPVLRDEDIREVIALTGRMPVESLKESVEGPGETYTILHPEVPMPVGMFGVNPCPEPLAGLPVGIVWLLASERLFDYRLQFLRESRRWVQQFHESYPVLANVIDSRNDSHLRWVSWLGFAVDHANPSYCGLGDPNVPFYRFIRASVHV